MGSLIFIAFVGFIAYKIFSSKSGKSGRDAWEYAGLELGLLFESGGFMSGPRLQGSIDGCRVVVDTFSRNNGKTSTSYTRYVVSYLEPVGLGLSLTRQGRLSGVAKFFGAQDVEIGDPSFDAEVTIKASDPDRAREYLNPDRQYQVWRAIHTWTNLHIEDRQVRLETSGRERDEHKLTGTVRQLVELARAMSPSLSPIASPARRASAPPSLPRSTLPPSPPPPQFHTAESTAPAPPPMAQPPAPPPPDPEPHIPPPPVQAIDPSPPDRISEPVPTPAAPPPATGPTLEALCAELFKPDQSGSEAEKVFRDRYQGQAVRWQAELRSLQRTSYDIVFGDSPITRASFDAIKIKTGMYGYRKVQVIAQFPEAKQAELQAYSGQTVSFQGTLVRVDGLMRSLYVADARLCT